MREWQNSKSRTVDLTDIRATRTKVMLNLADPGGGIPLVAVAGRWRRACPHGIRGDEPHQGAPDGTCSLRHAKG